MLRLGIDGEDNGAGASVVAEFAEVDALPCAEVQASVSYGDSEGNIGEGGFGMSGHIV